MLQNIEMDKKVLDHMTEQEIKSNNRQIGYLQIKELLYSKGNINTELIDNMVNGRK